MLPLGLPGGDKLVFAGFLILDEVVAAQLGEEAMTLVGTSGDELVAGVEDDATARSVEVATATANGEQVEAGLGLELQLLEGLPVGG